MNDAHPIVKKIVDFLDLGAVLILSAARRECRYGNCAADAETASQPNLSNSPVISPARLRSVATKRLGHGSRRRL